MTYTDGDITIIKGNIENKKITLAIKLVAFSEETQFAATTWTMIICGEPNKERIPVVYHDIIIDLDSSVEHEYIESSISEAFNNYVHIGKTTSIDDIKEINRMRKDAMQSIGESLQAMYDR